MPSTPYENITKTKLDRALSNYGRLSSDKKAILLYSLDNETITRHEAINLIGLKKTKIHQIFTNMIEENLISRKGSGRSTYYVLNKQICN